MSKDDMIYEIAKTIGNSDSIKQEINDSFNVVIKDLQNKYITKLNSVVESQKTKAQNEMSKEIQLLNALKPFTKNSYQLDDLLNMMTTFNTVKNIHSELLIASQSLSNNDESIHPDGIYDLDYNTPDDIKKNNTELSTMFPILLLLFTLSKN